MDPLLDIIARHGLDDDGWRRLLQQRADAGTDGLPAEQADLIAYTRLNLHRTLRLERTWLPSPELSAQMTRLDRSQTWLVISEPWCGDSAQCLPCLMVTARLNPLVRLRVLPRDDHPAVMDRFLTGGKRSVPILAALDDEVALSSAEVQVKEAEAQAMSTAQNKAETEARRKLSRQEADKVSTAFKPNYECLLQYVWEQRLSQ
jgi:hypothetical protein